MSGERRTVVRTDSAEATLSLGERLGRCVLPETVVGLEGQLGAGKTVLARGIALGLGVPESAWAGSPSFIIVHRYDEGRMPLVHVDLYRIEAAAELADLGWEEIVPGEGVAVIEWADRFPGLLGPGGLRVEIGMGEGDERTVRLTASARPAVAVLEALSRATGTAAR